MNCMNSRRRKTPQKWRLAQNGSGTDSLEWTAHPIIGVLMPDFIKTEPISTGILNLCVTQLRAQMIRIFPHHQIEGKLPLFWKNILFARMMIFRLKNIESCTGSFCVGRVVHERRNSTDSNFGSIVIKYFSKTLQWLPGLFPSLQKQSLHFFKNQFFVHNSSRTSLIGF